MDLKFGKLDNSFIAMEKSYSNNGEISWSDFNKDQKMNNKKIVNVSQKDFEHGTLRIREPCVLKLTENIYFNPNRPETWINKNGIVTRDFKEAVRIDPNRKLDWWPEFSKTLNKEYFEKEVRNAYRLGFFAAITLESEDIIINLNNFTIQQHPEHALQQRFFSVIELADQPFVPKQGPANFGKTIKSSSHVMIKNGKIGLSSHHGIHGNGINNILIKNVDFEDNEVCSIALNGCTDAYLVNIIIKKNRHDIPVLGTYSAGRFLKLFTDGLKDAIDKSNETYEENMRDFKKELDQAFNSIIMNHGEFPILYKNESGLIDGNYYGIIINPMGIAVNAPLANRNNPKSSESCNIYIKSVSINNIKTNINEIIALRNSKNDILTTPSGSIFQFFKSHRLINDKYYYKGNTLSNLQIELAQLLIDNPHIKKFLGNFKIDKGLLTWKRDPTTYFTLEDGKLIGNGLLQGTDYDLLGNGDSMFHVNKGTFGLKIDGLNTSLIDNLTITNISSFGKEGSILPGNYIKSHPKQNQLKGYRGHLTFGVEINASNDVTFNNLNVNSINSEFGSSYGINVSGESIKVKFIDTLIDTVKACEIPFNHNKKFWPNPPTNARGILVNEKCDVSSKNFEIRNIIDTPECILPSKYEIYSFIKDII